MAYKVLIVDDEEIVCRGLAKFVKWQEYGFSVEGIAYSVDEALALMESCLLYTSPSPRDS